MWALRIGFGGALGAGLLFACSQGFDPIGDTSGKLDAGADVDAASVPEGGCCSDVGGRKVDLARTCTSPQMIHACSICGTSAVPDKGCHARATDRLPEILLTPNATESPGEDFARCGDETAEFVASLAPCASPGSTTQCGEEDDALIGVDYDVTKSRFAFGGTVTVKKSGDAVLWTGPQGGLAIDPIAGAQATPSANAEKRPVYRGNADDVTALTRAYFVAMGVADCQIGPPEFLDGSRTVRLYRQMQGIRVVESIAYARFDDLEQTSEETFLWPTIPAVTVRAAKAFRDQLSDPEALAVYKAKLPVDAQGDGGVAIHHPVGRVGGLTAPIATWDSSAGGTNESFDRDGNRVNGL